MIASPLIGHRGCARLAPENTLAAMTLSRQQGLDWVEIDANLLGDGTPVMFHDSELDRLTPARGRLMDLDWATARQLDVGSHFSAHHAGERLPSLDAALSHIAALGLGLNLEIKHYPDFAIERLVDACIDVIERRWRDFDRLLISSFSGEALERLHAKRPDWRRGQLWVRLPDNWMEVARNLQLSSLHLDYRSLSRDQVQSIKAAGYDLYCYTVNEAEAGPRLRDWGVDGLITDDPGLFDHR